MLKRAFFKKFWLKIFQGLITKHYNIKLFSKLNLGKNSYIDPTVQIFGWRAVLVGSNSALSEDVWINANKLEDNIIRVLIGNNCHIGRRNYFSTATKITISDYSFSGLDCHFLSCGHVFDTPMIPYLSSGITEGKPIFIGVNCWLTTSVTVLEGVSIGHGSVIGARSVVTRDIPPFSIAAGNPCKVIKRYNFKKNEWVDIADWVEEFNQFIPCEFEYLESLKYGRDPIDPALHASSKAFGWI